MLLSQVEIRYGISKGIEGAICRAMSSFVSCGTWALYTHTLQSNPKIAPSDPLQALCKSDEHLGGVHQVSWHPSSVASRRVQCVVELENYMEKVVAMRRWMPTENTTKQGPKARPRNRSGWWRKQRRTQHLQGDLHDIKARRDDWLQVQAAFFRPLRRPTENHAPGHQMQNHPKSKLKLKS